MKNYYEILEVDRNASDEEIKKSFKTLAKKYHPDQNQGNPNCEQKFKEINEAYNTLSDKDKKSEYDKKFFGQSFNQKSEKENKKKNKNMSSADFFHTQDIFESFFGFNPKNGETNFSGVNKDVKPMKTNEAFEKIFGKNLFKK